MSISLSVPACALAIGAHPDDVEFWAGATLARWAASGCEIHLLVCTDGSKGTWDAAADIAALVERRRTEQQRAAETLSPTATVHWLGEVDGELQAERAQVERTVSVIRKVRPTVVLGHDPWKRYRLHPDHRASGFLVTDAVVAARDPHFFAEQRLAHHRPEELLLFEADEPNHAEPASEEWLQLKLAALEAHESQVETTHLYNLDAASRRDAIIAFHARERAKLESAGAPFGINLAESFHRMDGL